MDATLHSAKQLAEDDLKKIASFGSPEKYEFGTVRQNGRRMKVIYRTKREAVQPA